MASKALDAPMVAITVVFSEAPRCVRELVLHVPSGCMASEALELAALAWGVAPDTLQSLHLGVWAKPVSTQHALRNGDRLEVYRALTVDPKVARRERFVRQGSKGAGLFSRRRAGGKAGY